MIDQRTVRPPRLLLRDNDRRAECPLVCADEIRACRHGGSEPEDPAALIQCRRHEEDRARNIANAALTPVTYRRIVLVDDGNDDPRDDTFSVNLCPERSGPISRSQFT